MSWKNIDFNKIIKKDIVRFIVNSSSNKETFVSPPGIVKHLNCLDKNLTMLDGDENDLTEHYVTVEEIFTCDPYVWLYKEGLFQYQKWHKNNEKLDRN